MIRVLLALDDFNELTQLQILLKKVGMDVDGVQKSLNFEQAYLGLNPKVVVATSHGTNIDGVEMIKKIKRHDGWPKIILATPTQKKLTFAEIQEVQADYILRSPINPYLLLKKIAQLNELNYEEIKEKLNRLKGNLEKSDPSGLLTLLETMEEKEVMVANEVDVPDSGQNLMSPSKMAEIDRQDRFSKWIDKVGPLNPQRHFDNERIREYRKKIRSQEGDVAELDDERRSFVKALFSKNEKKSS